MVVQRDKPQPLPSFEELYVSILERLVVTLRFCPSDVLVLWPFTLGWSIPRFCDLFSFPIHQRQELHTSRKCNLVWLAENHAP